MIKPYKHLDFNNSVLVIGAKILVILKSARKIKYHYLLVKLMEEGDENSKFVFPQALSFLFLLGKVDYCIETDEVELIL
jgi:hypothetical protein